MDVCITVHFDLFAKSIREIKHLHDLYLSLLFILHFIDFRPHFETLFEHSN